ncbi:MAG: hypothetical protein IJT94_05880 [Oscillibacter sp.]|nr:hypothetical protein [Oscillibacter sp.]
MRKRRERVLSLLLAMAVLLLSANPVALAAESVSTAAEDVELVEVDADAVDMDAEAVDMDAEAADMDTADEDAATVDAVDSEAIDAAVDTSFVKTDAKKMRNCWTWKAKRTVNRRAFLSTTRETLSVCSRKARERSPRN